MDILIGFLIALLVSAVVIYIVGRLGLGMTISSFSSAIIAAIVIAVISYVLLWLLGVLGLDLGGGLWQSLALLVVAAVVLLIADRFLPGMTVKGFLGALIAAVSIAIFTWIINVVLGLVGIV